LPHFARAAATVRPKSVSTVAISAVTAWRACDWWPTQTALSVDAHRSETTACTVSDPAPNSVQEGSRRIAGSASTGQPAKANSLLQCTNRHTTFQVYMSLTTAFSPSTAPLQTDPYDSVSQPRSTELSQTPPATLPGARAPSIRPLCAFGESA